MMNEKQLSAISHQLSAKEEDPVLAEC